MFFKAILILNTTKKLSTLKGSKITKKKKKRDYRPCNIAYVKDVTSNAVSLFSNFKAVQK